MPNIQAPYTARHSAIGTYPLPLVGGEDDATRAIVGD